jgi:adenylate cyclase
VAGGWSRSWCPVGGLGESVGWVAYGGRGIGRTGAVSDTGYGDFEFERRFFVRDRPVELLDEPDPVLIVQSYYLAQDGYALRLRVQASGLRMELGPDADPLAVLDEAAGSFDFCAVTIKGPMNVGTRYEAEREIDTTVGIEMIRRGGHRIVKNRYSVWLGADGWVIDVFGGANSPLVIAECERAGPVTDLQIPAFCVTEVTDDARFANDGLAAAPYAGWAAGFERALAQDGPRFLTDFGRNDLLR